MTVCLTTQQELFVWPTWSISSKQLKAKISSLAVTHHLFIVTELLTMFHHYLLHWEWIKIKFLHVWKKILKMLSKVQFIETSSKAQLNKSLTNKLKKSEKKSLNIEMHSKNLKKNKYKLKSDFYVFLFFYF